MQNHDRPELVIIGAGLSGLFAAYLLQEHYSIVLLEARGRIGGRIETTPEGIDLGPTWVWPHHKLTLELAQHLELHLFKQHAEGDALYDDPAGVQRFQAPPAAPAFRFVGGVKVLTHALYDKLHNVTLHVNTPVDALIDHDDQICIQSGTQQWNAPLVISTLPPRLLNQSISFSPPLSHEAVTALSHIPTWMGGSAKAVVFYERPFWREAGLSGFCFSNHGILGEIHDASQEACPALFGFFHTHRFANNPETAIVDQLVRLFGPQAAHPKRVVIKDWGSEPYTSVAEDIQPLREHPHYGLNIHLLNNKFHCIGTEYSFIEGGYLEGALYSALQLANTFLSPANA